MYWGRKETGKKKKAHPVGAKSESVDVFIDVHITTLAARSHTAPPPSILALPRPLLGAHHHAPMRTHYPRLHTLLRVFDEPATRSQPTRLKHVCSNSLHAFHLQLICSSPLSVVYATPFCLAGKLATRYRGSGIDSDLETKKTRMPEMETIELDLLILRRRIVTCLKCRMRFLVGTTGCSALQCNLTLW
jgi:hypothetical protein